MLIQPNICWQHEMSIAKLQLVGSPTNAKALIEFVTKGPSQVVAVAKIEDYLTF